MTGQAKARYVRAMFGRIARRYDLLNHLMSFGRDQAWRQYAARLAGLPPGGLALDVATGTADQALALAGGAPDGRVVGVDFSPEMMALGQHKVTAAGMSQRIQFVAADALELPFTDKVFACVTSAFALRNVTDISQALAEMRRVVRPGGQVIILEATWPTLPGFRQIYDFYFRRFVPLLGGWISGQPEAYAYLPASVARFVSPEQLAAMMEQAGLEQVRYSLLSLGTVAVHRGSVPQGGEATAQPFPPDRMQPPVVSRRPNWPK